ncbi:MAG: type II toxin-antitoxin system RelE/ParE family toxin [Desulfobacteraceae bacterium]|jgi:plasmid stabilization system protein ParE
MKLYYTDRAKDDIELAFSWYEQQQRELGLEFICCMEDALKRIMEYPEIYPVRYACFRGCPLKRFPFSIFYSIENNNIIVHSVFDNRQNPEKKP